MKVLLVDGYCAIYDEYGELVKIVKDYEGLEAICRYLKADFVWDWEMYYDDIPDNWNFIRD